MYENTVLINRILNVSKHTTSYTIWKVVGATIVLMGGMGILAVIYIFVTTQILVLVDVGKIYEMACIYLVVIQLTALGFGCVPMLEEIEEIYRYHSRIYKLENEVGII